MVDKELIERYRKTVKPVVASWLLNINHEGMGEQDKEEFERDFDEILDLALIGLKYKAQLSQEDATNDATSDTISRQAAIDALHMHLMYRMGTDSNKKRLDEWINNLPSAQPERKVGKWTEDNACEFCGFKPWYERDIHTLSYCPNCGADMRGEQYE